MADGNRNSPGLSGCYGLGLDGAQLVSGDESLGSPGREVTAGAVRDEMERQCFALQAGLRFLLLN